MPKSTQRFRLRNKLYDSQIDGIKKWPEMDKEWNNMRRVDFLTHLYREGIAIYKSYCWTELEYGITVCDFEINHMDVDNFRETVDLTHRDWIIDSVEPPPNMLNLHGKQFGGTL